ncbi:MAG: hypothetical protein ACK4SY_03430 [Pyrobaculum sp.]
MYLQLEVIILAVAMAVLVLLIFFISRRQPPPQPLVFETGARYTPGEQEIMKQLEEVRERIEKMIPPYGRVGYVPSSPEELRELLGFEYIKVGERELGMRPAFMDMFEKLEVDYMQAHVGGLYVYIVRRGGKKLVAVGSQYLDYLTYRFLSEFLDYTAL